MKKINKLLAVCLTPLILVACDSGQKTTNLSDTSSVSQPAASVQDKVKNVFEEAKSLNYFKSGSMMVANQAYVLFDPQCPHCAKLWNETKGINGVSFNWIPVSILNGNSTKQGAAILSSSEPLQLMHSHEESMSRNMGGIKVEGITEEAKKKMEDNTKFFSKYFESVPTLIYQNAKTKEYGIINGSASKAAIEERLGLK